MTVTGVFGQLLFEQIKIAFVFSPDEIGSERIPEMLDLKTGVVRCCAGFDQKSVHRLMHTARKPDAGQISKKRTRARLLNRLFQPDLSW